MALRSRPNLVINPKDLQKLATTLKGLETDFVKRENHAIRALKRAAEPLRKEMGDKAPVDEGLLAESFRSEKLKRKYIGGGGQVFGKRIGAKAGIRVGASKAKGSFFGGKRRLAGWRAHFQELGTKHHKAQPHIRPAIRKHLRPGGSFRTLLKYELQREYLRVLRKYKR